MISVMNHMMNMNGTHMAPGIKPGSPGSNTTTPNTNQSMMSAQNPQTMPQQFAAFSSFVDRGGSYPKTGNNQAFWNSPFGMPLNVGNDGRSLPLEHPVLVLPFLDLIRQGENTAELNKNMLLNDCSATNDRVSPQQNAAFPSASK